MVTYRDAEFGFSYSYPADFKENSQLTGALTKAQSDATDPEAKKRSQCIQWPLLRLKQGRTAAGDPEFGFLVVAKIDYRCMDETNSADDLGGDAQQVTQRILGHFGQSVTEDAMRYKLDTHEAAFVQGSAPAAALGEGMMMHAAAVCALMGQKTMCWLIIDTDHKAMPGLVATTLTFDGHGAVPLVPKDMVEKW